MPKISVVMAVHNGADTLDAAVDSILGRIESDFELIVVAGQYALVKAPMIVAEAIKRLQREVTWVCAKQHHDEVRALAGDSVRLEGWTSIDGLRDLYDTHGVFLFPSFFEGFGKAFLEAMSRVMCVIATDAGGAHDVITDGIDGILVAPGDTDAIAAAVHARPAACAGDERSGGAYRAAVPLGPRRRRDGSVLQGPATMTKRIALVASHVIQYQDPFFRLLAAVPDIDLTVYYCSRAGVEVYRDEDMKTSLRWDIDLLQGYRHVFLRNLGRGGGYTRLINPAIVPAILRGRYDAVILFLGWGTITSLLAIAACRMTDTPFFLFGDSSFPPAEESWRGRMRSEFLWTIFGLADGFLVSGVLNAKYYEHYGADSSRFFLVPWAIDNERFVTGSRFAHGEREALRARFDIASEQVAFVYSGKLIPRKDPLTLLRAVASMRHRHRAVVVFLGDGELREELETFAGAHRLNVRFAGFVNQTELPKHYAMCDAFVLPTLDDPRGTVINEAMACGLPVVVTDRTGPIGDIAKHGDNAFVFPAGDVDALAAHLDHLAGDASLREQMGRRSREIIPDWSYERGVEGVKEALR